MESKQPVVLIAPLNWGLGHATRCIPLIRAMQNNNFQPILCGNGASFHLLKREFPHMKSFQLPDYNVTYPKYSRSFTLKFIAQLPAFLSSVKKDQKALRSIAKQTLPKLIISDNRYGFRLKHIRSILITHQIQPIIPKSLRWLKKMIYRQLFSMMSDFHEIWVPDFEFPPDLSGQLSHQTSFHGKVKYCGPLSRFQSNHHHENDILFDILVIISGPEQFRSQFENQCLTLALKTDKKVCIIAGRPLHNDSYISSNLTYFSHLNSEQMEHHILHSDVIITGAGYSSIMDMFILNKQALIVPTPGQTEQEYLADYHSGKGLFLKFNPESDHLETAIQQLKQQKVHIGQQHQNFLNELILNLKKLFL